MDLDGVAVSPFDLIGQHVERPSVEAPVDDRERRVERCGQLARRSRMVEVVGPVDGAAVPEGGRLRARLAHDLAQPVDAHRDGMADGAQIGRRSGAGRIASCSSVRVMTASRTRRLYCGHMP